MGEDIVIDIINRMKRTLPISHLEDYAKRGNAIAQLMLGEIYFFSIVPADYYISDLLRIVAMDIAIQKNHNRKSSLPTHYNQIVIAKCTNEPDFDKALLWYDMATKSGISYAAERAKQIRTGNPHFQNCKRLIQFFGIEYSREALNNYTYKSKPIF